MTTVRQFTPEIALDLWYDALKTENGIAVSIPDTADTVFVMNHLYSARADINDSRLASLSIHIPVDGKEIFIYKKAVEIMDD